jgi:protein-S-isoprenylcysteine O-methyltransferase Ste14
VCNERSSVHTQAVRVMCVLVCICATQAGKSDARSIVVCTGVVAVTVPSLCTWGMWRRMLEDCVVPNQHRCLRLAARVVSQLRCYWHPAYRWIG